MIAAVALAAALAAPSVDVMVVGRSGTLKAPRAVTAKAAKVKRCKVAAGTPLAALLRTGLKVKVKDFGGCGGSLYVRKVSGQGETRTGGWVYKVDNKTSSRGAADPSGRLKRGSQVLWYFCKTAGRCQSTLDVAVEGSVVRVSAYDDAGRATPVAGATVTVGSAAMTTGPDGRAALPAGSSGRVVATKKGFVRSFPATVGP